MPSIGKVQTRMAMGPPYRVAPTIAASVSAIDAVGADDAKATMMESHRPIALANKPWDEVEGDASIVISLSLVPCSALRRRLTRRPPTAPSRGKRLLQSYAEHTTDMDVLSNPCPPVPRDLFEAPNWAAWAALTRSYRTIAGGLDHERSHYCEGGWRTVQHCVPSA